MTFEFNASNVISSCALLLTVCSLWMTRRHQKLSVTPHLGGFSNRNITDEGLIFSYELSNNGIGPARIKKFVWLLHGKEFAGPADKYGNYTEALLREHLGNKIGYTIRNAFTFGVDSCLKQGDAQNIVDLFIPGVNQSNLTEVLAKIEGVELMVEYESFYGQRFVFDTRVKRE